ncbi:ATP-grasp domain-containing protein [Acidiferrobacter sp.]|uniref:ATP-grasp domain-containing protein n=1 Tax=Acidiferrobacter sp. TaxID=1872107 RepID=UPI00261A37DB|nr:ATP-grasp domain-containing protein [Acidiferrobacter sp.]
MREPLKKPRLLLIAPFGSYRTAPFLAAAGARADVVLVSEGTANIVESGLPGLRLPLHDLDACERAIREEMDRGGAFLAVLGLDDWGTEVAGALALRLGLAANPPQALEIARRKDRARAALQAAGVPVPWHRVLALDAPLPALHDLPYPLVLKPVALSGSRGVMRVDDEAGLRAGLTRLRAILGHDERAVWNRALIERFVPGFEIALEGLLTGGVLQTLAIFDKPEPLDGPFFEETFYITPSRLDAATRERVREVVERGARAYGLHEGPIHAECRLNAEGIWVIEIAARTIGGLCARLLRFGTGLSLEDVVVRHALKEAVTVSARAGAAGVLMIPIPGLGILKRVEGLMAADRVPGVVEIVIDAREGQELVPLPEGASYLGFVFAQGPDPTAVYETLRTAHGHLRFVLAPLWRPAVIPAATGATRIATATPPA